MWIQLDNATKDCVPVSVSFYYYLYGLVIDLCNMYKYVIEVSALQIVWSMNVHIIAGNSTNVCK